MKLYFSGIADIATARILAQAGVTHALVDPTDLPNVADWTGDLALDSGAYRAWKRGTPIDLAAYAKLSQGRGYDFVVAPDVIGDSTATMENYNAFSRIAAPARNLGIPVWHWGADQHYLHAYLEQVALVGIGGLVPLMRAKDESMLAALRTLCERFPNRFHLFGINWLKAIEDLRAVVHSGDTSKFLDGARYGHVVFVNSRTGHLQQAPARVIPEFAVLDRTGRCAASAQNLNAFCNGGAPWPA
jgi:hypothetical protein